MFLSPCSAVGLDDWIQFLTCVLNEKAGRGKVFLFPGVGGLDSSCPASVRLWETWPQPVVFIQAKGRRLLRYCSQSSVEYDCRSFLNYFSLKLKLIIWNKDLSQKQCPGLWLVGETRIWKLQIWSEKPHKSYKMWAFASSEETSHLLCPH